MSPAESLVERIRGEYLEMPGLRLTVPQACRLWQVDRDACETILHTLLAEKVLAVTADGAYVALPTPRAATVKASLSASPAVRRSA